MIGRLIIKMRNVWDKHVTHRQFKGARLDHVKLGPELNKRYEIRHPQNLVIGYKSVISGDLFINALGGVQIGKYCHIAKGLTIYSHNHNWKSTKTIPYDDTDIKRPVKIGDCVWIGCNVTIAPGAQVGDGVIISSGSVVFGEIPRCAIIRGNPAQVIGYRDIETFDKLYREESFA